MTAAVYSRFASFWGLSRRIEIVSGERGSKDAGVLLTQFLKDGCILREEHVDETESICRSAVPTKKEAL